MSILIGYNEAMAENIMSGEWLSKYSYTSGTKGEAVTSEHTIIFKAENPYLVGRSLPQADGSSVVLQLLHDPENRVLTGTWRETTSLAGKYKGVTFHGALQFLLDEDGHKAAGAWVGYNSTHTHINSGEWSLEKKV